MRLVDLISHETRTDFAEIMLLRHSTSSVKNVLASGGTIEEYTHTQPIGSRYDFFADGKPQIHVVVVIVYDCVYSVYRVLGIEAEGTTYSLVSPLLRELYRSGDVKNRPMRRFQLERIPSISDDASISGWENARSPTARSDGKVFWEINVTLPDDVLLTEEVAENGELYEGAVRRITVNAYERNAIAREKCIQHYGTACAVCGFSFAAFYGPITDGFIHVHHLRPLSEVTSSYKVDYFADLRPVCPNCHAVIHMGGATRTIEEVQALIQRATPTGD